MHLSMPLKDYLIAQRGHEAELVSMERLLAPFGIYFHSTQDSSLPLGLVCEDLDSSFSKLDLIDPMDVATSAFALGYDDASLFLEEAPLMLATASLYNHREHSTPKGLQRNK